MLGQWPAGSCRRTTEAMDRTLVYAIVPNTSLDATVHGRARRVLDEQMGRTRQTMALEAQEGDMRPSAVDAQFRDNRLSPALADALRLADGRHEYGPLLAFARS